VQTLEQIKSGIEALEPADFEHLTKWLEARGQNCWDTELARDASNGRLDALYAKLTENDCELELASDK